MADKEKKEFPTPARARYHLGGKRYLFGTLYPRGSVITFTDLRGRIFQTTDKTKVVEEA